MANGGKLTGTGRVYSGARDLGIFKYTVEISASGQGMLVSFDHSPRARDSEILHLSLDDGRFLLCQHLDHSAFCAVIGDGPQPDRRWEHRPPGEAFPTHHRR